jgi:hypothetical protein
MANRERQLLTSLAKRLKDCDSGVVGGNDVPVVESTLKYLNDRLIPATKRPSDVGWDTFLSFWPPRLLRAYESDEMTCFFGAGLSMASGLPSWTAMLKDYFGLDPTIMSDEYADALTQAELASHRLGAEKVQSVLREKLGVKRAASTNHFLTAALRLPFYVTTNYDSLFEDAWNAIADDVPLVTITNDANLREALPDCVLAPSPERSYLFKLHGSISRRDEHLILTRSDYRRHYRSNIELFSFGGRASTKLPRSVRRFRTSGSRDHAAGRGCYLEL